jgi:hypothetical protein
MQERNFKIKNKCRIELLNSHFAKPVLVAVIIWLDIMVARMMTIIVLWFLLPIKNQLQPNTAPSLIRC